MAFVCFALANEVGDSRLESGEKDRNSNRIFDFLKDAFFKDDEISRLPPDKCGWRSLVQIAKGTGVSVNSFYGKKRGYVASELQELLKEHLVEMRYFSQERGRGGEVVRFRVLGHTPVAERKIAQRKSEDLINESKARSRIAVLPFVNLTPDPSDEYLADGITEEIISTLSNVSGLEVISRTSVMAYKGTTKKLRKIGQELDVGSILEGSFRKAGNRSRVTAQLIEVNNDRHVWAQSYDRVLDDVLQVQIDIAKQVTEALRIKILAPEMERLDRMPTDNPRAYDLYLKGRHHWNKRTIEEVKLAEKIFEQSVEIDPNFALGYVGAADCGIVLGSTLGIDPATNLQRARKMVDNALELDSSLAEAHTSKGHLLTSNYELYEAEAEFRRSIQLKPSYATAHQWYARLLMAFLRWSEALEHIEKAVQLDPFSTIIALNHALYYVLAGDYTKASEIFQKTIELEPNNPFVHFEAGFYYAKMGMREEAKREMRASVKLAEDSDPQIRETAEAFVAHVEGDKQELEARLPELEKHSGKAFGYSLPISEFYFWIGKIDKGFEWLERSYGRREPDVLFIRSLQGFDGVRADPRYLDLLKRIGFDRVT